MVSSLLRMAMVSMHTSPLAAPGTGDSGGMNVSLLAVAAEIAKRGVEVDLLCRAVGLPRVIDVGPGVQVHELAAGPVGPTPKNQLFEVADAFGESVARLAGYATPRYGLIHAHYWLSGLATLPVALELGLGFVQSFHTVGAMKNRALAPRQRTEPEQRLRTELFLASQANAVVAASGAEVTAIIDDLNAPADRVWVVPPGVDVELFTPRRDENSGVGVRGALAIAHGRPILAVVGRVQPLKDQELAIRVLAELHSLRGWAPVLVIAGEPAPGDERYAASLHSLAAELGVLDDVRFVGALARDTLADLLAAASVTLIPSRSETFGLVALESAASGTPVIAAMVGGLLESVSHDRSGYLLDSRDPSVWAQKIAELLDDRARLSRLSDTARHYAEGFSWAATATALLGVYAGLP